MAMHPEFIVIHHTDSADGAIANTPQIRFYQMSYRVDYQIVSKEEFIQRKQAGQGERFEEPFRDIGYHCLIENLAGSYEAVVGRAWDDNGAHTLFYNHKALGLCLIGNFDQAPAPVPQLKAAAKIIRLWFRLFCLDLGDVKKHSDLNDTDCPGLAFQFDELMHLVKGG